MTITQPCTHENYKTYNNIGYDIDESGEEFQHLDLCECGMFRQWSISLNFVDNSVGKWIGEWEVDNFFLKSLGL